MALTRRQLLALGAGGAVQLATPGLARAASPWAPASGACCNSLRVLEIFCYGGLSQWENFWLSRDDDDAEDGLNWRGAYDDVAALDWSGCDSTLDATDHVHFADATDEVDDDEVTTEVHWGPATRPLWPWRNRCRAVVVRPDEGAGVHFLGIHAALTGHRVGDPRAAGLGTALHRRAQTMSPRALPYAYVLTPADPGGFAYVNQFAVAAGTHPGAYAPLMIKMGNNGYGNGLDRSGIGQERDTLLHVLAAQYGRALEFRDSGSRIAARDYASYESALWNNWKAANELHDRLGGDKLALAENANCTEHDTYVAGSRHNSTRRSLQLAAYLMSSADARHVTVLDGGVHRVNGDSPYDTHNNPNDDGEVNYSHAQVTSGNLWNVLDALADIIAPSVSGGGPADKFATETTTPEIPSGLVTPGFHPNAKISLDDTLVVIHTEFNRTPNPKEGGGRDHSQGSGHVALLLGGPVSGPSIAGNIRVGDAPTTATPSTYFTQADLRAGLLLAADIDPFHSANFRTSDGFGPTVKPAAGSGEDTLRDNLYEHLLGV